MKILVTGGTGVVGWALLSQQPPSTELTYTYYQNDVSHPAASGYQLDVRSESAVEDIVADINPDVIIHSAAMTDVDQCEQNPSAAHAINVEGTKNVVNAAMQIEAHLVFLSTSFVFDGTEQIYERDDPRNPINVYGETKADAERIIESTKTPTTIIRTDQPYGWTETWQNTTMVEWTLKQLSDSDLVPVFEDWYNMPIFIPELTGAIYTAAQSQKTGVYHAVGPDYINRYEFACEVADIFGYDQSVITPTSSENTEISASRPNVNLDYELFRANIAPELKSYSDNIEIMARSC